MIALVATLVGLAMLLVGERVQRASLRYAGKPLASAGFLIAAASAAPRGAFATWLVVGLVLGAIGDVALLSERAFVVGLGAFLLGHVAYAVAVAQVVPAAQWASPLALAPAVAVLGALAWLWPHLGSMRVPVIAYVIVIAVMVIAAIAFARAGAPHGQRFLAGAVLFFASDLAVARDKFVAPGFANRAWGLPTYYAGQLLIAWSIAA